MENLTTTQLPTPDSTKIANMDEKHFSKYAARGSYHWKEMRSKDPRVFNAYHQAHYEWILKLAGNISGKKVLDIGCGDGALSYLLARAGAVVTGIDNEPHGLAFAEENLARENKGDELRYTFVNASAYEMPFTDETFDLVVSCEVIEHVQEPLRLLKEAHRVLKKGGTIILTTPHRLTEHPLDDNHVKEYFPGEIRELLSRVFSDVTVKQTHHLFWLSFYLKSFRLFGNRAVGRWFISLCAIYLKWNPFMLDFQKPAKRDMFATLCAWGKK